MPLKDQKMEERLTQLLEILIAFSSLDFTTKAPISDDHDMFDTIGLVLNAVGEELYASTVSKDYLNSIIQSMMDALIVIDQNKIIKTINHATIEMSGYSETELVGQSIGLVLDYDVALESLSTQYSVESILLTKNGNNIPIALSSSTLQDTRSSASRAIFVAHDITKRIRAEEALAQHAEELQNALTERDQVAHERKVLIGDLEVKNAELERFTYTVSHDLKSPLITIGGYLGYLEQDARNGNMERLEKDIAYINKAAGQMKSLLDKVLELSRIGRVVNPPVAVSFKEIVDDAVALVQHQLDNAAIQIKVAENFPIVQVDRVRLVEVVQNLVDNAIKFTQDQPNPHIEIGYAEQSAEQFFYVRDNGIGIDARYHEKVFGLFEKLNPASNGTGVGLALVKRIIEFHQGRVWVESNTENTGVTFNFTLPRNG